MARMLDMLDPQAKQYMTGLNLRSVQVEALNKLLSTNYNSDAKEALKASGFTDSMLSSRQLHSLIVNQACTWLVEILSGNWTACPIPKSAGLNQSLAIAWFKEQGQSVAERIATKKALRAKAKSDAKGKPEKLEPEETFTAAEVEAAKLEGKAEALKTVFAINAADISADMLLDLIEALDRTDRHRVLASLAAKYPTTTATNKRGKGTTANQQPTLPV